MMLKSLSVRTLAVCAGIVAAVSGSASAQEVAQFYKGKRLTILVGSSAGGGYDVYSRLISRHIGRHIPGNPGAIVQNMPGGGGLTATNYLYNISERDGTVIGGIQRALTIAPLVNPQGVKFDVNKLNWIGSINSETGVVVVWHTAPHKTIEDIMKTEILAGGSGAYNDTEIFPRVYNETLGTKFKIISGYESTDPILLAMERGEVQALGDSSWSNWKGRFGKYLQDDKVRIVLQSGLEKHPDLKDVPLSVSLAKSDEARQILELLLTPKTLGRPYVAPPEIPEPRVKALRTAFLAMAKDTRFLAEAKKLKKEISPVSGDFIQSTLKRLYATPKDIVEKAKQAISPQK